MDTVFTFFLMVTAFLGTMLILFNPIYGSIKRNEGMTAGQFQDAVEQATLGKWIAVATKYGCFIVIYLTFNFVLEPFFVIGALVTKTGERALGYAALALIAYGVIRSISIGIATSKKEEEKTPLPTTIIVDGKPVDVAVISRILEEKEADEKRNKVLVTKTNPVKLFLYRFIAALPIIYLWYVFFVRIGVIPQYLWTQG